MVAAALENAQVKNTGASNGSATTLESLRAEVNAQKAASGHDTIYDRNSKVVNIAIQDIGMTRYQWYLFVLRGFGWMADNLWRQGEALTLPFLQHEFGISEYNVRYRTLAMFCGFMSGCCVLGMHVRHRGETAGVQYDFSHYICFGYSGRWC